MILYTITYSIIYRIVSYTLYSIIYIVYSIIYIICTLL